MSLAEGTDGCASPIRDPLVFLALVLTRVASRACSIGLHRVRRGGAYVYAFLSSPHSTSIAVLLTCHLAGSLPFGVLLAHRRSSCAATISERHVGLRRIIRSSQHLRSRSHPTARRHHYRSVPDRRFTSPTRDDLGLDFPGPQVLLFSWSDGWSHRHHPAVQARARPRVGSDPRRRSRGARDGDQRAHQAARVRGARRRRRGRRHCFPRSRPSSP